MNLEQWKRDATQLLEELSTIDFGYPIGENIVRPPALPESVAASLKRVDSASCAELAKFYAVCDGLSWPDVHNGYFVVSHDKLGNVKDEYEPTEIKGEIGGPIVIFGSSGNGALFAIHQQTTGIVLLPSGRIENNIYHDTNRAVRIIANNFNEFAQLLLRDLRAFVADTRGYKYLS